MYPVKSVVYHPCVARKVFQDAPMHNRYVGKFHWSAYWRKWDKVINIEDGKWVVCFVDNEGNPLPGEDGRIRKHRTEMDAAMFADKPFDVKSAGEEGYVLYTVRSGA